MTSREELIKVYRETQRKKVEVSTQKLEKFVKYTFDEYEFKWFHKLVAEYLDKLQRGEVKKLMIFIPPQHGKSELSSRRFPAYLLGKNPKLKIGLASYSANLSNSFNRDCQNIIDNKAYKDLFPQTRLNGAGVEDAKGELRNVNFFETLGHRGFLKSVGVGGSLTGTPLDIGIIDDPFKDRQEANSKTIRDKVWNWYQDVFLTRLHNDSRQLLLFTRWHEDDIAGRILDPESEYYDEEEAKEWTIIALPALKEVEKPHELALDINDPRQIDEALWEEKHSREKYIKRRRINPTGFASLDQQRPSALDGNKILKEWLDIKKPSELPFDLNGITANFYIDGAYTESTKNDPTGLMAVYYHKDTDTQYILNATEVRKELYEFLPYFNNYADTNKRGSRSTTWIEPKASGKSMKSMLSKRQFGGHLAREINGKTVAMGKWNRVETCEPFLASGKVVLVAGSWNKSFVEQCASFPNGTHDDMVDCLCYAVINQFVKPRSRVKSSGVL